MFRRTLVVIAALGACSTPAAVTPATPAPPPLVESMPPTQDPGSTVWSDVTRSPWPLEASGREREMMAGCGEPDGALAGVAAELAGARVRGAGVDADLAAALLRARGEPHVRPRVVSVTGHGASDDARVRRELAATRGEHGRCGVAFRAAEDGGEIMVAVIVDALADLDPLPRRGRTGEWLTFAARAHVPISSAKLVVLGSRGLPRTVPTAMDRTTGRVAARFALDRPGMFKVQLVADLGEGPRPLLEAQIFADVALPPDLASEPAPGESVAEDRDDTVTLGRMAEVVRRDESLGTLRRDARLDALALAHAEEMKTSRAVAHDLGEGDLAVRFESAGLAARVVGENVARARSLALAHRALYASPSHRMNLLRADYSHVGLGVVRDGADVYVCEVFAGGLR